MCTITNETEVETEAGVELLSREEVGVYDVSILSADEPGALLDWLSENGYAFPEEGGPILNEYVEEGGWYFVAARVLPGKSARLKGDVHPLWFSFDTEHPIYPMRLTALLEQAVEVLIYVLANHRMTIERHEFQTEFAGELTLHRVPEEDADLVAEESAGLVVERWRHKVPEEDAGLVELLTRSYYVTKLQHHAFPARLMTEDLHFKQAASDATYRKVIYRTRQECVWPTEPAPTQVASERAATEPLPNKVTSEQVASEAPTERTADQLLGGSGLLVLGVGLAILAVLAGLGLAWRQRSRR